MAGEMTAKRYVRDVGGLLRCRTAKKREIKRRLLMEINAAVAAGESTEDVLGRMGIAWECANRYNDTFDRAERRAAKRERALRIWGVILLAAAVLLAVVYQKLPRWSDIGESTVFSEEQVTRETEEIIRLYSGDDFEAVNARMNDDMKRVLNPALLQDTKSQMKEEFGELLAFGSMYASEARRDGKHYAVVQVSVSYTNMSVTYTITFDEDMRLAGFYVK